MEFEYDPGKDSANRDKHGLSLADAARIDWATVAVIPDHRQSYGEARHRAYGWMDGRLHMLAFTMRGDIVRAISFRKANSREVKRYG